MNERYTSSAEKPFYVAQASGGSMKVALYARVSTQDKDQNPEIQLEALREYCQREGWAITGEYEDKASALDMLGRREWSRLMKDAALRKFDEILVWRLDRAFRDSAHGANTMQVLEGFGIGFRSISDLPMDIKGPMGQFLFTVWVAIAQLERATIIERINRGIQHAKDHGTKSGKPIGRKSKGINFTFICNALRATVNTDGSPNYTNAALWLEKETGIEVGAAFIWMRVARQAVLLEKQREELLNEILSKRVGTNDTAELSV